MRTAAVAAAALVLLGCSPASAAAVAVGAPSFYPGNVVITPNGEPPDIVGLDGQTAGGLHVQGSLNVTSVTTGSIGGYVVFRPNDVDTGCSTSGDITTSTGCAFAHVNHAAGVKAVTFTIDCAVTKTGANRTCTMASVQSGVTTNTTCTWADSTTAWFMSRITLVDDTGALGELTYTMVPFAPGDTVVWKALRTDSMGAVPAWPAAVTPTTPVTIPIDVNTDRVLSIGDSWDEWRGNDSSWYQPSPGWGEFSPIAWWVDSILAGTQTRANAATMASPTVVPKYIKWFQNGVGGTGVADLATNVQDRVVRYKPTVVLWHLSSNDWLTPGATWQANATTFANAVDAGTTATVYVISNMLAAAPAGEKWSSTGWPAGTEQTRVTALNDLAKTWIAGRNAARWKFCDVRGLLSSDHATLIEWESLNNLPEPGVANFKVLSSAHQHPIFSSGQQILSERLWQWIQWSNL